MEMYSNVAEKMVEKLELHRNEIKIYKDLDASSFAALNPIVWDLVKEIEDECHYGMTFFQASWAINRFVNATETKEK